MKKLIFLFFILFAFVACGNDDDTEVIVEEPQEDYTKYVGYKLEYYDLKADVKSVERVYYNIEGGNIDTKRPSRKERYYFDKNGVLVKAVGYTLELVSISEAGEYEYRFKLSTEQLYTYDEKYRLTEHTYTQYNFRVSKTIYTFDEENKTAVGIEYEVNSDGLTPKQKYNYVLDENGRINTESISVYLPKEKKSETLVDKREYKYIKEIDLKSNAVLFYGNHLNAMGYNQISDYYEQSIEYYDGTSGGSTIREETIPRSNAYGVSKYSDYQLNGNAKSLIEFVYTDGELVWDNEDNILETGHPITKKIMNFDSNGVCIEYTSFRREFIEYINNVPRFGSLREEGYFKYEYDSKFRITSLYDEYFYYENVETTTPKTIDKSIRIITYDDTKNTATALNYLYDGNNICEKPYSKTVYNLDPAGFINMFNYEEYSISEGKKTKNQLTGDINEFNETPYVKSALIKRFDTQKNMIEQYNLNKFYNEDGSIDKTEIRSYRKREITYY
ncbi:hypothetical protein [Prevotella sp. 10(H)]|uniref:hypothetical protein n=1 Tax=Prevotella sp. 10(H) TaxID=1158294 RepID=UPI0012DCA53A|nr:hypothetical protein [Prevotella sp. 10(H)]